MISHRHRCIFVHIPKTGGTSLENLIWPPSIPRSVDDLWLGFVDAYHNKVQTGGLQHLFASQIRTEVGVRVFDSYFRFSFVRNPWDRAVSQYTYMERRPDLREFLGMRQGASMKEYLQLIGRRLHVQWEKQVRFLQADSGELLVNFIGRFESFESSARSVIARLGIGLGEIPHENAGVRGPYQTYYDEEAREMVAALYAEDIRAFGYAFEPTTSAESAATGDA